ncbi:hypothetical protein ATANTOWER_017603 [Ataeniobius toweri]|uniref:Uncharacterized protein n=1 Tax=Ataeniobius toweri TaxID=208326 RepID=A0ABU7BGR9_9TELE|nr:hypothetical protein [Ataeniobius toweri]
MCLWNKQFPSKTDGGSSSTLKWNVNCFHSYNRSFGSVPAADEMINSIATVMMEEIPKILLCKVKFKTNSFRTRTQQWNWAIIEVPKPLWTTKHLQLLW